LIGQPQTDGLLATNLQTLRTLNGGFIITSLLWASILAALIDHRFAVAAINLAVAAGCSLVGIIHSPMPGSPLVNPFRLPENLPPSSAGQQPIDLCVAYLLVMVLVVLIGVWNRYLPLGSQTDGTTTPT
jgi:AGZA family xanthine/uracil permease-like MFS transporter